MASTMASAMASMASAMAMDQLCHETFHPRWTRSLRCSSKGPEATMGSNRVSNKGSITSLMQDPRRTLEHMFSVSFQKYLPTGLAFCVSISRESVNMLPMRMDTSLWHANKGIMDVTKKSVSTHKAFMSNVMPSKMVTNVQCSEF